MNDFDRIAWCYDSLKKLVFGDRLDHASGHFLSQIKKGSEVLILGGGTGKIVEFLPKDVKITYLEKSRNMIRLAKQKSSYHINFIQGDILNYPSEQQFHYVICPFVFDLFEVDTLKQIIKNIHKTLRQEGQLIVSDFNERKKLILVVMYLFFKVFSRIQARRLPPIHQTIMECGFKLSASTEFSGGLVFSNCYTVAKEMY